MILISFAVLMVIGGIVVGPSVLGWARIDAPVEVLSSPGPGMLLFLAGLEIDVGRLSAAVFGKIKSSSRTDR